MIRSTLSFISLGDVYVPSPQFTVRDWLCCHLCRLSAVDIASWQHREAASFKFEGYCKVAYCMFRLCAHSSRVSLKACERFVPAICSLLVDDLGYELDPAPWLTQPFKNIDGIDRPCQIIIKGSIRNCRRSDRHDFPSPPPSSSCCSGSFHLGIPLRLILRPGRRMLSYSIVAPVLIPSSFLQDTTGSSSNTTSTTNSSSTTQGDSQCSRVRQKTDSPRRGRRLIANCNAVHVCYGNSQ